MLQRATTVYVWSQVKNLSCTYCQTPLLKATASADYKVAIYDRWRCLLDELFKITLIRIDVIVPNVFTPNNDGFNDYFEVKRAGAGSELQIFDKNGALVFSSKNYQGDLERDSKWRANRLMKVHTGIS